MSWLSEIVNQHSELESPKSFWYWSALAAVSAVVKDNVWIPRGGVFNTYPNIYVMLHAESGMKKGPPVAMSKQLVKAVNNTRIISGRSSIQGILKELGTAQTQPGGKINAKSVAFICSSELSSSIVEDKVATKILTDLFDRSYNEGEWKSLLKMENFQLKDPTVTMLTATNEAMSEDFFTKSAIQGGYFARTFIIHEQKRQTVNSLIYPLNNPPNYINSANYLKQLSQLSGPFAPLADIKESDECKFRRVRQGREIWFSSVGLRYDEWYEDFVDRVGQMESKDETGTLNRFGDSVLKVAMLLSLAEEPILKLSLTAMDTAIGECEKLLGNVHRTTLGKYGISQSATLKNMIIMELYNRDNHQVSRTMLMKKMWMHYQDATEFDEIMLVFNENGMILTSSVGNQVLYTMPEVQVANLRNFMEEKKKKK